ncbi:hypothetical protein KGM_200018 [Danaus plexippus plexippus]|uniref:Uncharacterized protein n=1 Tax=Danaus plexippus plexippus TaxID=278856 RepID=A0A212EQT3_DANPL|nr:hypothetical protein KGM_200018 [Danaus plexippus plexippus]
MIPTESFLYEYMRVSRCRCDFVALTTYIMPRNYKNSPDVFCFIGGEFTIKAQRNGLFSRVKSAYERY